MLTQKKMIFAAVAVMIVAGFIVTGAVWLTLRGYGKVGVTGKNNNMVADSKSAGIDADDDPALGNPEAGVTLINFGDFRCQFCARFQKEIKPAIMEKYVKTGKVKYVYRDLITMGDNSILAAGGANCAGEQGKYWQFADYLHSGKAGHGVMYTEESLSEIAGSMELDVGLFKKCLASGKYIEEVKKDTNDALANGANATPSVFINGRLIVGLVPLEEYERIIEEELLKEKNAQKSIN